MTRHIAEELGAAVMAANDDGFPEVADWLDWVARGSEAIDGLADIADRFRMPNIASDRTRSTMFAECEQHALTVARRLLEDRPIVPANLDRREWERAVLNRLLEHPPTHQEALTWTPDWLGAVAGAMLSTRVEDAR